MVKHSVSLVVLALFAVSGCSDSSDAAQESASGSSAITQNPSNSSSTTSGADGNQSATKESGYLLEDASVKAALAVEPIERTMWQRTLIRALCLKEQGINAQIDPVEPDAIGFNGLTDAQDQQAEEVLQSCQEKYQLGVQKPVTREDAIKEYQHRVATKACFGENQIIVSDPPSQNAFVAKFLRSERTTEDLGVWDPWDQFPDGTNPSALAKKCPRLREGA